MNQLIRRADANHAIIADRVRDVIVESLAADFLGWFQAARDFEHAQAAGTLLGADYATKVCHVAFFEVTWKAVVLYFLRLEAGF